MKLDKVHLYQKVDFEGTVQGYFVRLRDPNGRASDLDMTLEDGIVTIKSDKDEVMVPVNNIAFMKKVPQQTEKKSSTKK